MKVHEKIRSYAINDVEIDMPICSIDDYEKQN